jgi:pilus assembly protein Flp/PilA
LKKPIACFRADERGLAAVEYALVAGLIALTLLVGAKAVGTSVTFLFGQVSAEVTKWGDYMKLNIPFNKNQLPFSTGVKLKARICFRVRGLSSVATDPGDDTLDQQEHEMKKKFFAKLRKNEDGATAIEYALIAGLIGLAIITGAQTLGKNINTTLKDVGTSGTSPAATP